jgi:hypothetical protein
MRGKEFGKQMPRAIGIIGRAKESDHDEFKTQSERQRHICSSGDNRLPTGGAHYAGAYFDIHQASQDIVHRAQLLPAFRGRPLSATECCQKRARAAEHKGGGMAWREG